VSLVETASGLVDLERPQLQAAGQPFFGELHEPVAKPATHPRRIEVQLLDPARVLHIRRQHHQADDRAVDFGDPHVGAADDLVGHPAADLARRVHRRHGRQRELTRAHVDIGAATRIGVAHGTHFRVTWLQRTQCAF